MNRIVAAIGKMNFEGNIIPMTWFSHLTFESGKPNTVAIICLSEVIYWYRPVEIRDETSGKILGYRQKFRADKWQCHYQAMADRFGFTKDQVRNALAFLSDKGYVTLEFRHFTLESGTPLSNVLFIEPVPTRIAEITGMPAVDTHLGTETDIPPHLGTETETISAQKPSHLGTETETYTETPTEIPMDDPFDFPPPSSNPSAGLRRATDAHQRAVDKASGGTAPDPVEEAAKHLYQGFMGGPVPLPRAKKEREKWMQAAQRLLQRLPDGWELRAVCEAIDWWWAHPPEKDKFWVEMPCKDETLDLIARYYIKRQSSPQLPDAGDEAEESSGMAGGESMSPEEEERRRAWDKLWGSALGELELQTTKATFDTWIRQTQIVDHDGNGTYTVQAQNSFAMDWLENRLKGTVERTLGGILNKPVEVRFVLAGYVTKSNEL